METAIYVGFWGVGLGFKVWGLEGEGLGSHYGGPRSFRYTSILENVAHLNSSGPYSTFEPAAMFHNLEIVLALDPNPKGPCSYMVYT